MVSFQFPAESILAHVKSTFPHDTMATRLAPADQVDVDVRILRLPLIDAAFSCLHGGSCNTRGS